MTARSWSARSSKRQTYSFGYNAQTGEYGDLTSQGVIDPTKVVRNALQGAASIAGLLITTEAMVAERPKKNLLMRRCQAVAWEGWITRLAGKYRRIVGPSRSTWRPISTHQVKPSALR